MQLGQTKISLWEANPVFALETFVTGVSIILFPVETPFCIFRSLDEDRYSFGKKKDTLKSTNIVSLAVT